MLARVSGDRARGDTLYIMRSQTGRIGRSVLCVLVPQRWYWRGWLGLAKLLILMGFPLRYVGALLCGDGPAVAGWWWLYRGRR